MQKILAIDDKQDNLIVIRALLKNLLPETVIFTAQSGQKGLEIAQQELPDVILLDLVMPGMDGYEVCTRLKAKESTQHIPIIMLTAIKTDSKSRVKALDLGADAFLSKPIEGAELVAQINAMLRIKDAEDNLRGEIEDRKRAEENIRQQNKFLENVLESLSYPLYVIDANDYTIKMANSAAQVANLPKNLTCYALTHNRNTPCDGTEHLCPLIKVKNTKKPIVYEHVHSDSNGSMRHVEIHGFPIFDDEGNVIQMIEYTLDITERKRAEEALKESEERFRALFETMIEGVTIHEIIYDEKGTPVDYVLLDVNPAFQIHTGIARKEVIGKKASELYGTDGPPYFDIYERVATTGKPSQFEVYFEPMQKHFNISVFSPNKGQFATVFEDITKRKQAEKELKKYHDHLQELVEERTAELQREIAGRERTELALRVSEECYRELVNNMSSGVAVYEAAENGQDFIFKDFNRAGERIDNIRKEDLIGKSVLEMFPGVKEFGLFEVFQRVWQSGEPEHQPISIYKDERIAGWRENYVYKLPSGEIVAVYNDITERKQAEEELRKHREHLEQLVAERTIKLQKEIADRKRVEHDLQKAKIAAEAANQAKSEFLANMSHDLRTPLNAILGYAQILKDDENLNEHQREGLETIQRSGDHLLQLINDILDLSKIEARRVELQESECYLPEFLENIVKIIHVRAQQKGLAFLYECDPNLPTGVRADEKHLREVLLNLLGNAVKFTEKGKVTFVVSHVAEWSDVREERLSDDSVPNYKRICFQVEDTGIGIAPEKIEEIFLPFQQVGDERYSVEGTGLGLTISHRLIEMMGSKLHVESAVGKGSVFWFELNVSVVEDVVASAIKSCGKILGYKGEQRTVLVVDDEPANRAILVDRLLSLGFGVLEAEDGRECIERTLKHKPDIIFLDLRMPVLDGFGATQQIRKTEGIRDVVIIAVSASVFEETRKRAFAIGFDDFLIKPFQFENLLDLLQMHLRLEWIYEEKPEEPPELAPQTHGNSSLSVSLPPEELKILLDLASKSRIKPLLQHLSKIEVLDETFRPFVEELRQLAKHYQSKEIVKRLQQIKERKCRPDKQD